MHLEAATGLRVATYLASRQRCGPGRTASPSLTACRLADLQTAVLKLLLCTADPLLQDITDCLLYTIPCTACFAMCQDSNEIKVGGRQRLFVCWMGGWPAAARNAGEGCRMSSTLLVGALPLAGDLLTPPPLLPAGARPHRAH